MKHSFTFCFWALIIMTMPAMHTMHEDIEETPTSTNIETIHDQTLRLQEQQAHQRFEKLYQDPKPQEIKSKNTKQEAPDQSKPTGFNKWTQPIREFFSKHYNQFNAKNTLDKYNPNTPDSTVSVQDAQEAFTKLNSNQQLKYLNKWAKNEIKKFNSQEKSNDEAYQTDQNLLEQEKKRIIDNKIKNGQDHLKRLEQQFIKNNMVRSQRNLENYNQQMSHIEQTFQTVLPDDQELKYNKATSLFEYTPTRPTEHEVISASAFKMVT